MVTQTGAHGNDIFDQAAVSLQGDITMSGGCKVVSDDMFIVYYCDSSWTRSFTTVTCSAVTTPRETGVYYDLGKSAKMVMTASAAIGNLAYKNTGTKDISPYQYISAWIYSTAALNLGDLKFKIATNTALGGTVEQINIPAIPANTGTRVLLAISTPANFSSLDSIGIYQAVDKGAFTLYVDNVIATNNLSKNGDIYANGNISIQPSAIVNGTASATGTLSVDTGGGAKVWGTQTPGAPTYDPQAINIQSFIDLATGPGSTHYTSWPSGWTSGTHSIGPAYFDGDITIGGSNTITLTGDVYVNGGLTITGGALVQGPYCIVAHEITVSGGSSVILAKGNIPLMISRDGDFHISNSAQIAAIVYAPNGQVHISGGVGANGYNLYGAAVGKSVLMEGSTQIKYLSGIRTMPWPAGWGLGPGPGQGTGTPTVVGYDYR
jgi:cytoskeletal protein CcmA (bactofilin family)